ncbi:hypothetical protein ABZ479_18545 [Streptomyces sp. NPDC005722]
MTTWTKDELDRIEHACELSVAPRRDPGTLGPPTTVQAVRAEPVVAGTARAATLERVPR